MNASLSVVEVTGRDAGRFLHGMLTQDIKSMPEFSCLPFCTVTRIGKMVALGFIAKLQERFFLVVESCAGENLIRHLNSYIIAEKVEVRSSDLAVCEMTTRSAIPCLRVDRLVYEQTGDVMLGISRGVPHGVIRLTRNANPIAEQLRVAFGFPKSPEEISAGTIPPELCLENIAISYTKGCYLGQEVIQRIQTYGNPSERLCQSSESGNVFKNAGDPIMNEGKKIGRITSSVFVPEENRTVSLGFIAREHFELAEKTGFRTPPFVSFYRSLVSRTGEHSGCGGRVLRVAYGKFEQSDKNPVRFACCDSDPVDHLHAGCVVNLHATHMCAKCYAEFELPFQK